MFGSIFGVKTAHDRINIAQERHERNQRYLEDCSNKCCVILDKLGVNELTILSEFKNFADTFEQIHNRPEFDTIEVNKVKIPSFKVQDLKHVSLGATTLVSGLSSAVAGIAAGMAVSGATTAAVATFGVASTGVAIKSLSGAALTNATLAYLGGGSLAAGGGGMALGATVLGASSLGVALIIGAVVFSIMGAKAQQNADEVVDQVLSMEKKIGETANYLKELTETAETFNQTLVTLTDLYHQQFKLFMELVDRNNHWDTYTEQEMLLVENMVLIVGVIFAMCNVQLVLKSESSKSKQEDYDLNTINKQEAQTAEQQGKEVLAKFDSEVDAVACQQDERTSKPLSDIEQWQKLLGEYINLNSRADYERHIEKCRELLSKTKEPLIKETMPDHIKSCKDIMRLY